MDSENLRNKSKKVASINEKRKATQEDYSDAYYPVAKKLTTKIREWDLPKLDNKMIPLNFEHELNENQKSKKTDKKTVINNNLPKPALKSIDDLFNKTKSKPIIYWISNGIESIVSSVIESLLKSIESNSNENEKITKTKSINMSNFFQHEIIKMNCFDNGTLIIVYKNFENKLVCSIFDKNLKIIVKSTVIPIESSESTINLIKFENLIYLTINKLGQIYVFADDLTMKEEIKLQQNISRLLGLNDSFIYYKPESENSKLESRINVYDRQSKTRKALGQCNSPQRPFYFSKTLTQLENYDNKYFCLDMIDDTFKIMDDKTGLVINSIKMDNLKHFLITSNNQIVLCSKQYLNYIKLNGSSYALSSKQNKQTKLDDQLRGDEIYSVFNDCHENIYLFDKHVLYVY